jgi:hypothetical protein
MILAPTFVPGQNRAEDFRVGVSEYTNRVTVRQGTDVLFLSDKDIEPVFQAIKEQSRHLKKP